MKTAREFYLQKINPDNERFKNDPIHAKIIELIEDHSLQYCDTLRYVGRFLRRAIVELKKNDIGELNKMRQRAEETLKEIDMALDTFAVKMPEREG